MLLIVYKIVRSTGLTCVIENAIICVTKNAFDRELMMIYQVEMGKSDKHEENTDGKRISAF